METIIVEVHAAEGGNDAKLLVLKQVGIYAKYCIRRGL
jgi:protein subunit release factor A